MPFPYTFPLPQEDVDALPAHIEDHVERARLRVLEQYKSKEKLDAFITVYVEQLQTVEDALWQLFVERTLDGAVGAQLDVLGRVLGLSRAGYDDDDYRVLLRAQVKLLRCSGTVEQLYEILALVVPGATLAVKDSYPAAFKFKVRDMTVASSLAVLLASFVRRGRVGGVWAALEWSVVDGSTTFRFDTAGQGWDLSKKWAGALSS